MILTQAFAIIACGQHVPGAKLAYEKVYEHNGSIAIRFVSSVDLEELFKRNRVQKPVRTYLLCALGEDVNFDIERRMSYTIEGNFKVARRGSKIAYQALGSLYASRGKGLEYEAIKSAEMIKILTKKDAIPCKVIITVYLSSPYYSDTLYIPMADLKKAIQDKLELKE